MKLSAAEQDSLVQLLTRIYTDIRDIEQEFRLLVGGNDFRPRIEYFHDAVRAFTGKNPRERQRGGRLSVELLAYDLSCLRYIHAMPLSSFKPHGEMLSPHQELVKVGKDSLAVKSKRPDRAVKERIIELYQHYAVLFAALLKPFADADFKDRVDDLNQDVSELSELTHQLEKLGQNKAQLENVVAAVAHLEGEELRQTLMQFIQKKKYKQKSDLEKMTQYLRQSASAKDKEIAGIESAHLNFALAQLGIFEGSKDMLKKMAGQGMNLVGKFVQASINETKRQMGR